MGSSCRIVTNGGADDLAANAQELVQSLEHKWSRFLADSEVSHANRNAGNVTVVSGETFELFSRAVQAHELTGGRFNPLMLNQLSELGYGTPWQEDRAETQRLVTDSRLRPGACEPIALFHDISAVMVPAGAAFDPGGIGKGLAADLVTIFLDDRGSTSSSVELGGDLRVSGTPWCDTAWRIGIASPFDSGADIATFTPHHGAVATSSTLRRRWTVDGEERHHLLDPTTGRPAETDLVAVSACSTTTWWAEVAAKVALIAGSDCALDLLRDFDTPGITVDSDGVIRSTDSAAAAPSFDHELAMS